MARASKPPTGQGVVMNIVEASRAAERQNPHGVSSRELHSTEHVQVMMLTLQPGQALKLHSTPVDAFFYVLEGEGVVEIGDEREPVAKDMLIDSPAKIPHRLLNDGDGVFRFLVVKTPRQADATRML